MNYSMMLMCSTERDNVLELNSMTVQPLESIFPWKWWNFLKITSSKQPNKITIDFCDIINTNIKPTQWSSSLFLNLPMLCRMALPFHEVSVCSKWLKIVFRKSKVQLSRGFQVRAAFILFKIDLSLLLSSKSCTQGKKEEKAEKLSTFFLPISNKRRGNPSRW